MDWSWTGVLDCLLHLASTRKAAAEFWPNCNLDIILPPGLDSFPWRRNEREAMSCSFTGETDQTLAKTQVKVGLNAFLGVKEKRNSTSRLLRGIHRHHGCSIKHAKFYFTILQITIFSVYYALTSPLTVDHCLRKKTKTRIFLCEWKSTLGT